MGDKRSSDEDLMHDKLQIARLEGVLSKEKEIGDQRERAARAEEAIKTAKAEEALNTAKAEGQMIGKLSVVKRLFIASEGFKSYHSDSVLCAVLQQALSKADDHCDKYEELMQLGIYHFPVSADVELLPRQVSWLHVHKTCDDSGARAHLLSCCISSAPGFNSLRCAFFRGSSRY